MAIKFVCPLIVVTDMERSKEFYTDILGQSISMDAGENVTFQEGFSLHERSHFARLIDLDPTDLPAPASMDKELYFEADDLDTLFERLKEEDVRFLHEVREQPWMQRVIRIFDPDGNIIEIGETIEHMVRRLLERGLTPEEIEEKASVPANVVRDLLEEDQES